MCRCWRWRWQRRQRRCCCCCQCCCLSQCCLLSIDPIWVHTTHSCCSRSHSLTYSPYPLPPSIPPLRVSLFFFGLKIPMAARPFNVLSRQLWQLLAVFNGQKFALAGGRGARRCAWKWAIEGAVCVMHAAGNYYGQSLDLVLGPFINTLSLCHQPNLQLICAQRGKGEKKKDAERRRQ